MWLGHQKNKINDTNNEIYIKLSENKYIKKSLDEYLKYKEKNKDKEKLTFNQSKDLLFEFCNINKRCPFQKEEFKNKNIGMWLHNQKKKINDIINEVYIKLSENNYVKKLLDEYLEFKKENKNNENLTFEQSVDLLVEFCNINKRCPKPNEQYKNKNIYNFLQNLKKKVNNINNELYIKLSGNEYIKESLDKYLNKK